MRRPAVLVFALLLLAARSSAQENERRMISVIQQIRVSEIDSTLPGLPFGTWLKKLVGEKVALSWELTTAVNRPGYRRSTGSGTYRPASPSTGTSPTAGNSASPSSPGRQGKGPLRDRSSSTPTSRITRSS